MVTPVGGFDNAADGASEEVLQSRSGEWTPVWLALWVTAMPRPTGHTSHADFAHPNDKNATLELVEFTHSAPSGASGKMGASEVHA